VDILTRHDKFPNYPVLLTVDPVTSGEGVVKLERVMEIIVEADFPEAQFDEFTVRMCP